MQGLLQVGIQRPDGSMVYHLDAYESIDAYFDEIRLALKGSQYELDVHSTTMNDYIPMVTTPTETEAVRLMELDDPEVTLPSGYKMEIPTP